jgi:hypothetical protein
MPTISFPHTNPRGQKIRKGGMWLINCAPGCQSEFRSGSDERMLRAQLESAGWQVNEEKIDGEKVCTYRCPGHRIIARGVMSGAPLPDKRTQSGKEKKAQGRASHDGGETP